jgi:hypothetical protein
MNKKVLRILLVPVYLLVGLVLLYGGYYGYSYMRHSKDLEHLAIVAKDLGYSKKDAIVMYSTCPDIGSRCYTYLFFYTKYLHDQLNKKILTKGYKPAYQNTMDGSAVFTNINYLTTKVLTADGYEDNYDTNSRTFLFDAPPAYTWSIPKYGSEFGVDLFENTLTNQVYKIDGKLVTQNIASLYVKDQTVLPFPLCIFISPVRFVQKDL